MTDTLPAFTRPLGHVVVVDHRTPIHDHQCRCRACRPGLVGDTGQVLHLAPHGRTGVLPGAGESGLIRPSGETTRRIERACLGLASIMIALIVAKTGGAL